MYGGVGDTGVNYVFTMRNEKLSGDGFKGDGVSPQFQDGKRIEYSEKSTPWTLGLSRSLGGGATVHFEHGEPDSDDDSSTGIWLQVDF